MECEGEGEGEGGSMDDDWGKSSMSNEGVNECVSE